MLCAMKHHFRCTNLQSGTVYAIALSVSEFSLIYGAFPCCNQASNRADFTLTTFQTVKRRLLLCCDQYTTSELQQLAHHQFKPKHNMMIPASKLRFTVQVRAH
jgi:hypothetical protein